MGFISEFKEFALKGSLVDMAIAFVMGGAFGKVTSAFVEKMFAPIVGLLMGGIDLADKKIVLKEAVLDPAGKETAPAVAIEWGLFLTAVIDFLIVAFVMFLIIKAMNKMKKSTPAPAAPAGPTQEELLMQIRDLLKK
ncbi:large-conductance mechanosensitive channel protein MscL [Flavobacterium columnare NBRC 100251 = ATCC 23463]|uniref:Large-conductance mechanosensitive channel n=2 Tax=Flavobacterium columnare TaxID=996 RepID=G8X974_FLACA|nr:large-conductance mechanosensitive channel protein MscL [Flavobacterium columnare]AEW85125.1 Large-conductance mechanosensitive channel [Flavobacterium columnare ATCC 49512]AMO19504.1 large-conductance mechanosensitive channel protein MscL [Flavobacterium columnare]ANO49099.1 Large-conductance mechanosensitive channel [Flavobacterium columnare]APT22900.1 large-conductance mechanosensitive channel [Flavobacterium columnare]AUX17446.1 large-conductance mechanosensitive channel [Flavobacterium